MYPKNAASPPRVSIGPVVAIADGAVQTSGVSVKVLPEGGSASAGGGTIAYEEGIVHYVPTQAETNYTAFVLIAYKASCIPATTTVVTTAASTAGQVVTASGTVTTLTNLPAITANWLTATGIAADAITAAKVASDVTTEIQSGLATAAALTVIDDFLDTEVAAILAAVDTEVAAIKAKTDYLPSATAGAAGGVFIAGSNAATSITTALTANITGNLSGSVGSVTGAVGSVASGGITAASIATNAIDADALAADAVTEIQSGLATASALSTVAGYLDTEVAAILADTNELQTDWANGGRLDLLLDGASSAGDPWTTSLPGAYGAGTAGKILGDNLNAPVGTIDTVVDAIKVKTDYLPSATAGASGGVFIAGSNAATSITTALTANITGNLSGSVGSVTGAVGSVTGAVGSVTGAVGSVTGNVGGSVGSLAAQAKTDVNAEVVDALATDTYAELAGPPAATSSLKDKLAWLFVLARNKVTQTATTQAVRNDADGANVATSTVSDDGTTFTRGEWS